MKTPDAICGRDRTADAGLPAAGLPAAERSKNVKREYVWISTKANELGTVAIVLAHHKTLDQARKYGSSVDFGGWEGPVPKDMYPIGKEIFLTEDVK